MVLESLIGPQDAYLHPWKIVLLGIVFATVAVWLSSASGFSSTGIIIVGFSSVAAAPFLQKIFDYDVFTEYANNTPLSFIQRNLTTLIVLAALFFGLLVGYLFWMLYFSSSISVQLFNTQYQELLAINPVAVGNAINTFSQNTPLVNFQLIFFHNLQVVGLVLLLSLIYNIGSIVILSWNASVIAAFLATVARNTAQNTGLGLSAILSGIITAFLGILPHGTLELFAYLIMALAGSLLSETITYGSKKTPQQTQTMLFDTARLFALSIVFLAVAAMIESRVLTFN